MKNKRIILLLYSLLLSPYLKSQNPYVQNILNDVEIDSMAFFVKQLSGKEQVIINGKPDTILSRHTTQPGNEKAFQFIKQKYLEYGLRIDTMQFSTRGKNILGYKIGTKFSGKKFIIGAHYDNAGGSVAPGADDNASGTAAVIEAARIFSNYSFPYTVVFASWDEEEQGLIGSSSYASLAVSNEIILGYINLDMLAWDGNNDSLADLHVRPINNSLQLADIAINANTTYSIGLRLHIVNPGSSNTDHASFWNNYFTAIGINEEYDGDFNPFWHTRADSLEHFNLIFYEKCAKLAFATLADCATDLNTTLGIIHPEQSSNIELYPNPANSYINIDISNFPKSDICFKIMDITGKTIYEPQVFNRNISVEDLQSGIYFITIFNTEFSQTQKFIVRK